MHSTSFGGLLAAALIVAPVAHGAAASPQYVTCDEIAKGAGVQPSADGAGENWPAMAKVVCSSIERMRQMSNIETKAEQDEIHRLYQTAVDGHALRIRAVPSCVGQTVADGDLEARVVKIVRGFVTKNGKTLRQSAAVRIMAVARWPEKLEGQVDTGQGDPVPVAWLFRCRSSSDCKIIDIQVTGSLSMTESIRSDLSTAARCAK
jgi:hypothetical protein